MTAVAGAARWYARRGLHVHPLRPRSKLPLLPEWQRRATTEADTLAAWWARWPDAGIGIATGAASGVIVVDVDPRHGGDDSLHDVEREHGELPATWRCLTAGGGVHVYLAHPGGAVGNRAGLWPGVDVRGDGGYVVAPPTELEEARRYRWQLGAAPHETPLASVPAWLSERLQDRMDGEPRPVDEWVALVRDGVDAGARNDAIAHVAGYLLRRRPAPRVVLELLRAWSESRCRPPLPDSELVATVDSIARREMRRRGAG
jgi:hypothetical protein